MSGSDIIIVSIASSVGRVSDSRLQGFGFELHPGHAEHCVLEQDTPSSLLSIGSIKKKRSDIATNAGLLYFQKTYSYYQLLAFVLIVSYTHETVGKYHRALFMYRSPRT